MWYCCEFALILQDSSEIEEESTIIDTTRMRPCTGRISLYSTADTTHDSTSQTHRNTTRVSPCTGRVRIVPETERFGNRLNLGIGALKGGFSCSRRQARQGRARERLERSKRRLGERKRSEKAKVGLRISFSIARIMISPLYLSFYCFENMFE
jgi:hypothetical protein